MSRSLRPPIFLLGNPRSGTTLLRLMLTCHRDIVVPPECGFAVWYYDKYRDWNPDQIPTFVEDVAAAKKFDTWGLTRGELSAALEEDPPASYAEAASRVYELYGRGRDRGFARWGDKNNFYIDHVATLDTLFPQAVFVHIVRDGRNVACSYKKLHATSFTSPYAPKLPWKIEEIADEWQANNDKIEAGLAELAPERGVSIRFEDLVVDPEATLRSLCAALTEAFDPAMLDYHRTNASQQLEPAELLPWKQKTLRPLIRSEVDRFRRELEPGEVAAFEDVAGDALERYGYRGTHA